MMALEEKSTRNCKEEQQSAKGRQVITFNLAITMRVTLAGIFLKWVKDQICPGSFRQGSYLPLKFFWDHIYP